mmetsp:Transcript_40941/g.41814  ORF Transcript_40941/g.41814 Transcript_40941/m.41814 type:complete len:195 (-) Transcript_40941:55-639(-)
MHRICICTFFCLVFYALGMSSVKLMETAPDSHPNYIQINSQVDRESTHELIFMVKQKNMDALTKYLEEISNPSSPKYGQHLTPDEVHKMTQNTEGTEAVKNFVTDNGGEIVDISSDGSTIKAQASVALWEKLLHTTFQTFQNTERPEDTLLRTNQYSLPSELASQVSTIRNTVQFPASMRPPPVMTRFQPVTST